MEFLCLDFINSHWYRTHKPFEELLEKEEWIQSFCQRWEFPAWSPLDARTGQLLDLRDFLLQTALEVASNTSLSSQTIGTFNQYLSSFSFHHEIRSGGANYQLKAVAEKPEADWMVYQILLSFVRLITEHPLSRLKKCSNPECDWIFYDDTKNHTKKWCGTTCASLIKVRKHRAKQNDRCTGQPQ